MENKHKLAQFDHDLWKLVEHYRKWREGYKDRIVSTEKRKGASVAA